MRRRALIFALLYTGAILYLSLYPGTFTPWPHAPGVEWVGWTGRRLLLDAVLNFLFYLPLGVAAGLATGRGMRGAALVTVAGSLLSLGVENLQLWTPNRYGTYNDWLMNSIGTCAGASAAVLLSRRLDSVWELWLLPWKLSPQRTLFLSLWLLWFTFPFVPRISLPATVQQIVHPAPWSYVQFGATFLGMASLRWIVGRTPWIWVAFLAVPAQAVLVDRAFSPAWTAGAILGWVLAAQLPSLGRIWGWVLLLWLVAEQFRPFTFGAEAAPFDWSPFASWYAVSATRYYPVIFGKLYLYTSVSWMLRQCVASWAVAVGLPLAVIAAGEWAQRYLPGRTPEVTDVVLLVAGLFLTALIRREQPQE